MKQTKRTFVGAIKDLSIVFLIVSMLLLAAANWLVDIGSSQLSSNGFIRKIQGLGFGGATGYELRSSGIVAAEPAQVALGVDGELIAANDAELDVAMEILRQVWAGVLSDKLSFEQVEEQVLINAIGKNDAAVVHYYGSIPVSVIADWMGSKCNSDFSAQTLVYVADEQVLFVRTGVGIVYQAKIKLDKNIFKTAQEEWRGVAASFAMEKYSVYPETILPEREGTSYYILKPKTPNLLHTESDTSLQALLAAFEYSPYVQPYAEQNGAVNVFVENVSTLRIHTDGLITYSTAGNNGTVTAFAEGKASGRDALAAQVDCARGVLEATLRAVGAQTYASLCATKTEGNKTTLTFLQTYDGIPVLFEQDFATFVFENGNLLSAQIHIQLFEKNAEKAMIMPAKQAAASANELQGGLIVAYKLKEGQYVPERYFLK